MSRDHLRTTSIALALAAAMLTTGAAPALAEDDEATRVTSVGPQAQRTVASQHRPGLPDDAVNMAPVLSEDFDACSAPVSAPGGGSSAKPAPDAPPLANGGDISFDGHRAFVACGADSGNLRDDGFAVVDIKDPAAPQVVSRFPCVASSSDIAVWGDLVFLAADTNNDTAVTPTGELERGYEFRSPVVGTGAPCNEDIRGWIPGHERPDFFRGVRVVSVADVRNPRLVGSFELPEYVPPQGNEQDPKEMQKARESLVRGAHNLTVVPEPDHVNALGESEPRVVVLISDPGAAFTRMLAVPTDPDKHHLIDFVLDDKGEPREWAGRRCQDIAVFLPRRLAACNQNTVWETLLFSFDDVSVVDAKLVARLTSPKRIDTFQHQAHHSSAFSWDGNRLLVTPETYRANPVCNQDDGYVSLGVYVYDISTLPSEFDPKSPPLVPIAYHERPNVLSGEFCTAKQVSVVPLRSGRDVAVVSWGGGGTALVDFTTTAKATTDETGKPVTVYEPTVELGRFLGEPGGSNRSFAWASHWYNGHVYVNNAFGCNAGTGCVGTATRGLDVLALRFDDPALGEELASAVRLDRFDFALQECHEGLMQQAWASHLAGCPGEPDRVDPPQEETSTGVE